MGSAVLERLRGVAPKEQSTQLAASSERLRFFFASARERSFMQI